MFNVDLIVHIYQDVAAFFNMFGMAFMKTYICIIHQNNTFAHTLLEQSTTMLIFWLKLGIIPEHIILSHDS